MSRTLIIAGDPDTPAGAALSLESRLQRSPVPARSDRQVSRGWQVLLPAGPMQIGVADLAEVAVAVTD